MAKRKSPSPKPGIKIRLRKYVTTACAYIAAGLKLVATFFGLVPFAATLTKYRMSGIICHRQTPLLVMPRSASRAPAGEDTKELASVPIVTSTLPAAVLSTIDRSASPPLLVNQRHSYSSTGLPLDNTPPADFKDIIANGLSPDESFDLEILAMNLEAGALTNT